MTAGKGEFYASQVVDPHRSGSLEGRALKGYTPGNPPFQSLVRSTTQVAPTFDPNLEKQIEQNLLACKNFLQ